MRYKCLSIAGFDSSGGAGIQADLKTFSAFGCYGMTVLTALPVQNTCGVKSYYDIEDRCIQDQLEVIFDDIIPDSIKVGMLFSPKIVTLVAKFLSKNARGIPIVVDPVMVAQSGDLLLKEEAIDLLKRELLPIATIITPNFPEAKTLVEGSGYIGKKTPQSAGEKDMEHLADKLLSMGPNAVLLKGGHLSGETSDDLLVDMAGNKRLFRSKRIPSKNTHGTGCTLSAAICACLALGYPLIEACQIAKNYLFLALKAAEEGSVGKGSGPVHHFYDIWPTINMEKRRYL